MKTRWFVLPVLIALFMTGACSVEELDLAQEKEFSQELVFMAQSGELETKTAFQSDETSIWWSPADEISIFYGASEGSKFTSTNTEEVAKAVFRGTLDAFTGETEAGDFNYFWAVYPYSAAVSCDGNSVVANLSDQQVGKAGSFAPNTNIAIAKSLGLSLGFYNACSWFRFSVKKEGVKRVIFRGNNNEDVAGKFSITFDANGIPTAPTVLDGKKEIVLTMPNDGVFAVGEMYYITLLPQVFQNGFTVTFETDDERGSRSINAKATYLRSKYNTGVDFDKNVEYAQIITDPVPVAVDLGLSVKWASFNLGASTPEGKGNDYAWGETMPKENYEWSTYKWSNGDNFFNLVFTKYCFAFATNYWGGAGFGDDKRILEPEDDAASVSLGEKWRMPTDTEWKELINLDNCWLMPTSDYNGTGVGGMIITSKKDGYTDKSIFLPSCSLYGDAGWFWSSCLDNTTPYSPCLMLIQENGSGWGGGGGGGAYRWQGLKIRPVYGDFVHVTGVSLSESLANVSSGESLQLVATVTPANASTSTLNWSSSDISIATVSREGLVTPVSSGTATITATTSDGGYTASCEVTVLAPSHPVPEVVDLGLSVKWASCNLGASVPEGYGNYYAWGETHAKDLNNFWWGYYKWCNGSSDGLTKYNTNSSYGSVDNMTVLEADDDAAHVKIGGGWRLPTEAEWEELITFCTWEWTIRDEVKGYNVTSKKSGYTDKWIFLPAPGYRNEANNMYDLGFSGYYWSSSLNMEDPNKARTVYFNSDGTNHYISEHRRSDGLSIRPVTE